MSENGSLGETDNRRVPTSPPDGIRYVLGRIDDAIRSSAFFSSIPSHHRAAALLTAVHRRLQGLPVTNAEERADAIAFQQRAIDATSHLLNMIIPENSKRTHLEACAPDEAVSSADRALLLALDHVVLNQTLVDFSQNVCMLEGDGSSIRCSYPPSLGSVSDLLDYVEATRTLEDLRRTLVTEVASIPNSFRLPRYSVREFYELIFVLLAEGSKMSAERRPFEQKETRRWASRIARQIQVKPTLCEAILQDLAFTPTIGKVDIQPLIPLDGDCLLFGPMFLGVSHAVMARRLWARLYPHEYSKTFGSRTYSERFMHNIRGAIGRLDGVSVHPTNFELNLPVPVGRRATIEFDILAYDPSGTTVFLGEVFDPLPADAPEEWIRFRSKVGGKLSQVSEAVDALQVPQNAEAFAGKLNFKSTPSRWIPCVIVTHGHVIAPKVPLVTLSSLLRLVDEAHSFTKFIGRVLIGDVFALPAVNVHDRVSKLNYSGLIEAIGLDIELVEMMISNTLE